MLGYLVEITRRPFHVQLMMLRALTSSTAYSASALPRWPASAGDIRDVDSIPASGKSPEGRHGNPVQNSCLENPMDRGALWATVHSVTKSQTQQKRLSMQAHIHCFQRAYRLSCGSKIGQIQLVDKRLVKKYRSFPWIVHKCFDLAIQWPTFLSYGCICTSGQWHQVVKIATKFHQIYLWK